MPTSPASRRVNAETIRRMLAVVGQEAPFDHGRQQMKSLADLEVNSKAMERTAESIGADIAAREQRQIQRSTQLDLPIVVGEPVPILYVLMDGTGVPVVKKEAEGRAGKKAGEPAHTREAKLGCVFTQTRWDAEGYPIRDPGSTTYTGAIETAEEFGKRLYLEAWNRGWSRAQKKVVIGDGAEWIRNIAQQHFPGAIQIVDLFHARQHVWDLARKPFPMDKAERECWITTEQDHLDEGRIEELVCSLRSIQVADPNLVEETRTQAEHFNKNAERMRYPRFRDQHLFVGSGIIEAGCKTVIAARLKQSGMFWTVRTLSAAAR
ncbi:MAG: ISKra4 family transposase [Bryobacteraceae bacterium]